MARATIRARHHSSTATFSIGARTSVEKYNAQPTGSGDVLANKYRRGKPCGGILVTLDNCRMLESFTRNSLVRLFGLTARLGLHRLPLFNRVFLSLYSIYKQYAEAGPVDALREFVPDGALVIDVGANVGFFSLRFAKWVGEGGKVISVEPEDRNYTNLLAALKREGLLDRVQALKAVATAACGTTFLEINPLHPADHKLSRDGTGLPVAAVTLDGLVQDEANSRPALVKIDVQGAEMLVLKGADRILRIAGPALFVELHEEGLNRFGTSVSAILDHLSEYGYQAYWLMRAAPPRNASRSEIHEKVARIGYVDVLFLKAAQSVRAD
jgi:FkbM family methyltransferase